MLVIVMVWIGTHDVNSALAYTKTQASEHKSTSICSSAGLTFREHKVEKQVIKVVSGSDVLQTCQPELWPPHKKDDQTPA